MHKLIVKKKPVTVEAVQFLDDVDGLVNVQKFFSGDSLTISYRDKPKLIVPTLEGNHYANVGDYIVKGVRGEFYPVRKDVFEETYEIVNETEQ